MKLVDIKRGGYVMWFCGWLLLISGIVFFKLTLMAGGIACILAAVITIALPAERDK